MLILQPRGTYSVEHSFFLSSSLQFKKLGKPEFRFSCLSTVFKALQNVSVDQLDLQAALLAILGSLHYNDNFPSEPQFPSPIYQEQLDQSTDFRQALYGRDRGG